MKINYLINEITAWDDYVDQHPDKTIYHLTAWKKIVESHFKKKTIYLYAQENEQIKGILPLVCFDSILFGQFVVSYPFVNYGGMLYSNAIAKKALLQEAKKVLEQEKSEFVEFRTILKNEFELPVKDKKVTFFLNLPEDDDTLMKSFKAKLRSQIRRPLKEGMYAKVGGAEEICMFYPIFVKKMRELGTPVYSRLFFEAIFFNLPDNVKIVTIYTKEHVPVSSAFIIYFNGIMEIPWAASLTEYNCLSPNMLLYWEVLRESIRLKCHRFDFGRCTKGVGTYRFKKQWGGDEQQLYWYYVLPEGENLPEINPDNPKYRLFIGIWKKLPLGVTKLLGPKIIKHLP